MLFLYAFTVDRSSPNSKSESTLRIVPDGELFPQS